MDNSSSSHQQQLFHHQGIDSKQMHNNDNYETIGGDEAYANFDSVINQLPSTNAASMGIQQHQNPLSELQTPPSSLHQQQYHSEIVNQEQPWKVETIECKEEIDHNAILLEGDVGVGSRYNTAAAAVEFGAENYGNNSSSAHYDYRGRSSGSNNSFVTPPPQVNFNRENSNIENYNNNNNNKYPYQMSSASKQLPTWYHPPVPPPPHHHYQQHYDPHSAAYYSNNFYPQHHPYQANYMAPTASSSTEHNMRNMIQMTANRYIFFNILSHSQQK